MSEKENLRNILKTMERDFKVIEEKIYLIKGKMATMRETIKHLEESESPKKISVVFGNKPVAKDTVEGTKRE